MTPSANAASIQILVDWFCKNGGFLSPDVEIAYDEASGFHVRATSPLTSPIVVRCPLKLTISHINLDPSQSIISHIDRPLQSQLQRCLGEVPDKILTYLLLIEQRCLAEEGTSAWQPYFDCLPKQHEMSTTLWFDEKDLVCLEGTDLYQATREKKKELAREYKDAVAALVRLGIEPEHYQLNYELYLWAVTIMTSRSFVSTYILPDVKNFPILFPVIDILNHTTEAKVDWTFQEDSFTIAVAEQDSIRPGDQIFNNYAPKQNGELLMGYGFSIPNNPIEQFALKMRLPPDMIQAAEGVGFYQGKNVPFGMPESLLEGNPSEEQHFLRPCGHIFGRYENDIPWLRGVPPWIVYSSFVATCMQLGRTPEDIDVHQPTGIIVLQVLLQLYEAVRMKSLPLPSTSRKQATDPVNVKQQYARIYREGQAKIIHYIRRELKAVITRLRIYNEMPPSVPVIVTTAEALILLKEEHTEYFSHFEKALSNTFNISISDTYAQQVAGHEKEIWTILIFLFLHLTLTNDKNSGLIHDWTLELLEIHTLPSITVLPPQDQTSTNNAFDETLLGSFILNSPQPVSYLNTISTVYDQTTLDSRFGDLPIWDDDDDIGLDRLGDKALVWATEVVEIYGIPLFNGPDWKSNSTADSCGMYMRPFREESPIEEKWIYEDVEVPEAEDEEVEMDGPTI